MLAAPPDTGVPYLVGISVGGVRLLQEPDAGVDRRRQQRDRAHLSGLRAVGSAEPRHVPSVLAVSFTCNIDHPNICMRFMVRFAHGPQGDNIGFHEIPKKDGVPIQSDAQTRLRRCRADASVRSTADAEYMWDFRRHRHDSGRH